MAEPATNLISWHKSLQKSLDNNQQLDFYNIVSVATISSATKLPESDIIRFRALESFEGHPSLVFALDRRSRLAKNIQATPQVEFGWHFALSREHYRLKGTVRILAKENLEKNAERETLFDKVWNKQLDEEDRKEYAQVDPDTIGDEAKKHNDLDDYNIPSIVSISKNFTLIVLTPQEIEHAIFAMPQVVADSRHPKFESLFQPYKRTKKYLHVFEKEKNTWKTEFINPGTV